jgi:hypothetical protein
MNLSSTSLIAIAVALAAVCFGVSNPGHAYAVPSQMSHEMSGTVKRIDFQTLTIIPTGASKPEAFAWNSQDTKFFRDGAPATVDSLHAGTHVQIHCSHPFFGSLPLLYRVSWQTRPSK